MSPGAAYLLGVVSLPALALFWGIVSSLRPVKAYRLLFWRRTDEQRRAPWAHRIIDPWAPAWRFLAIRAASLGILLRQVGGDADRWEEYRRARRRARWAARWAPWCPICLYPPWVLSALMAGLGVPHHLRVMLFPMTRGRA